MFDCGFYTLPSYKTVLFHNKDLNYIKLINNKIIKKNENISIKSYTYYNDKIVLNNTDKDEDVDETKFIFIPNNILFILNKNESKFKYGYFAFMMIRVIENDEEKKNDAIIGYSQNPFFSTFYRNKQSKRDKVKLNDKEWQLSIILGPFLLKKICINCCTDWLKKTRGINSKKIRAEKLKIKYNIDIYTSNTLEKKELDKIVNETLPNTFILEYEKKF